MYFRYTGSMIAPCFFLKIQAKKSPTKNRAKDFGSSEKQNCKRLLQHAKKKHLPVLDFSEFSPRQLVQKKAVQNCVVFGSCMNHEFAQTILDLLAHGVRAWIPVDALQMQYEGERELMLIQLRKQGAEMWNTDFILKNT